MFPHHYRNWIQEGSSIQQELAGNQTPLKDMTSKEEERPLITQIVLKSAQAVYLLPLLDTY